MRCGDASRAERADGWVTTWTTAQQLVAPTGPPRAARQKGPEASNLPASMADQTVRMVAHVSLGGRRVRVELSNMLNAQPLEIGAAHLAIAKAEERSLTGRIAFLRSEGAHPSRFPLER